MTKLLFYLLYTVNITEKRTYISCFISCKKKLFKKKVQLLICPISERDRSMRHNS